MRVLVVASEIIKNKYSSSLTVYKFIQALPDMVVFDILTEPMTVFDFDHKANHVYITKYKIPKKKENSLKEKIYSKFLKISIRHKKRYEAFIKELECLNLDKYDFIISFGGGGFFEPLQAISQFKTKAKKIGFIHDPYPGDLYPEPYKSRTTKSSLEIRKKLTKVFQNLDQLAFPSELLGNWMNKYYKFGEDKITALPHLLPTLNVDKFAKKQANAFLDEYDIKSGQFYLHAGTLLKHRPVKEIIKQFKALKKEEKLDNKLKLVFIGNVNYKIQASDEDVIIIKKRFPLDLINAISHKAKALLIIEHIADVSPFLPGKVPEYIAQQKPIMHFGPRNSETCRIVKSIVKLDDFNAELDKSDQIYGLLKQCGLNLSEHQKIINHFKIDTFLNSI